MWYNVQLLSTSCILLRQEKSSRSARLEDMIHQVNSFVQPLCCLSAQGIVHVNIEPQPNKLVI